LEGLIRFEMVKKGWDRLLLFLGKGLKEGKRESMGKTKWGGWSVHKEYGKHQQQPDS